MIVDIPSIHLPELSPNLAAAVRRAVGHLFAGGVVIAPTESAYGLFALATDHRAVARIVELKGRAPDAPLPLVVADAEGLSKVVEAPPEPAVKVMRHLWPGPLTMVLPARKGLPDAVTAGTGTVGVRISPHPVAAALSHACGPLTATSANPTGGPLARTAGEIDPALLAEDVLVVDGGPCGDAPPSTVARVDEDGAVKIFRAGPVTEHQLRAVVGARATG